MRDSTTESGPTEVATTGHDCCSPSPAGSCSTGTVQPVVNAPAKSPCPDCSVDGAKVSLLTVRSLVRDDVDRTDPNGQHYFCANPDCETVYFDPGSGNTWAKPELSVRVGIKETVDPIAVCYCFGHTKGSIREEITHEGRTGVIEDIRREIAAGNCACEVKNPSGKCCLGAVTAVVHELEAEVAASVDKVQNRT